MRGCYYDVHVLAYRLRSGHTHPIYVKINVWLDTKARLLSGQWALQMRVHLGRAAPALALCDD